MAKGTKNKQEVKTEEVATVEEVKIEDTMSQEETVKDTKAEEAKEVEEVKESDTAKAPELIEEPKSKTEEPVKEEEPELDRLVIVVLKESPEEEFFYQINGAGVNFDHPMLKKLKGVTKRKNPYFKK